MLFLLSKILFFLTKPFIWALMFFFVAFLCKDRLKKKKLIIVGIATLLFFSNEFIVGKILNAYEANYPVLEKYDVGIVLGGFSSINKRNNSIQFGWPSDRLFQAIFLYKKGVIKKILISGGNGNLINKDIKEADLVFSYLKEIGIPDSVILIENKSRNTVENALLSFKLLAKKQPKAKVLIITSAWHIPRAKVSVSKYFGNASYYPTNFIGKTDYDFSGYVVPSVNALNNWELLIKEWIGFLADKFRA